MKRSMTLLLALLFSASIIVTSCDSDDPDEETNMSTNTTDDDSSPSGEGSESAPEFTLNSVDGGQVSLSDFTEKPLVIFFFGSSCPLCIASAPSIESEINNRYTNNEIAIIGIDTWDGAESTVNNFRSTTGVTFDLLLNGSAVQSDYNTTYDRLFVVNGSGEIVFKGSSAASRNVDEVLETLTALLGE